jgi:predicted RNA-binding Zn-ribbon protein involved in translation (DUF1610 family)
MHTATIKHRCAHCGTMLHTVEKMAGRSFDCPNCDGNVTVPHQQALVPMRRPVSVPEVIDDDFDGGLDVPQRKRGRDDDDKPLELGLGEWAKMKVDVDRSTRKTAVMTFLGALLALLGVIVATTIGGKSKSS